MKTIIGWCPNPPRINPSVHDELQICLVSFRGVRNDAATLLCFWCSCSTCQFYCHRVFSTSDSNVGFYIVSFHTALTINSGQIRTNRGWSGVHDSAYVGHETVRWAGTERSITFYTAAQPAADDGNLINIGTRRSTADGCERLACCTLRCFSADLLQTTAASV